jgi:hypothetical protein
MKRSKLLWKSLAFSARRRLVLQKFSIGLSGNEESAPHLTTAPAAASNERVDIAVSQAQSGRSDDHSDPGCDGTAVRIGSA